MRVSRVLFGSALVALGVSIIFAMIRVIGWFDANEARFVPAGQTHPSMWYNVPVAFAIIGGIVLIGYGSYGAAVNAKPRRQRNEHWVGAMVRAQDAKFGELLVHAGAANSTTTPAARNG